MNPSIDLITEATRVWGKLRRREITYTVLEAELKAIEARYGQVTYKVRYGGERLSNPCQRCGQREAAVTINHRDVCGRCANGKPLPTGDEIDRGWEEYRDHR